MCTGCALWDGREASYDTPGNCRHTEARARLEAREGYQCPVQCCRTGGTGVEAASGNEKCGLFTVAAVGMDFCEGWRGKRSRSSTVVLHQKLVEECDELLASKAEYTRGSH